MGFKGLKNLDKNQPRQENDELQDFGDDDVEETLSLCDLALSNSDLDDSSCKENGSSFSSSSSSEQDYFEFFSEDFTAVGSASTADNIIFCGKLIPYKGAAGDQKPEKVESTTKRSRIFPWKSISFNKSTTVLSKKQRRRKGFSMKKVSALTTPLKSRWHLFAFGVGRFPMGMDLNEMKLRQSKKSPAKMFSSSDNGREVVESGESRVKGGLWSLLKVLSCRSNDANTTVKASFGCIPSL